MVEFGAKLPVMVISSLLGVPEEDQELLEVAACCGFEFDPLLAAEASGLERSYGWLIGSRFFGIARRNRS